MKVQPVRIPAKQSSERIIKRGALAAFRALRIITEQAKKTPGVFAQAASDVSDAWRESSRPNV